MIGILQIGDRVTLYDGSPVDGTVVQLQPNTLVRVNRSGTQVSASISGNIGYRISRRTTQTTLTASSHHGSANYAADIQEDYDLPEGRTLIYRIRKQADPPDTDFFEARLVETARGVWQVATISAHRLDLRGRGLMPAVLLAAKAWTGGQVRSSSNTEAEEVLRAEGRELLATRSWERMKARGDARYVASEDRYYVT